MNKKTNLMLDILIGVGTLCVVLGVAAIVATKFIPIAINQITDVNCCGRPLNLSPEVPGSTCTDTYYTMEDNKCHLVLCENYFGSNCTYEGANITFYLE